MYITRQLVAPLPAAFVDATFRARAAVVCLFIACEHRDDPTYAAMNASDAHNHLLSICTLGCDVGTIARECSATVRTIDLWSRHRLYCTTVE